MVTPGCQLVRISCFRLKLSPESFGLKCARHCKKLDPTGKFQPVCGNRRIQKFENKQVTFRYKASDTGQERLCTLAAEEFIHRFLQHVLPKGFVKVRYFGFFSSGSRKRLSAIKKQLGLVKEEPTKTEQTLETTPSSKSVYRCPVCGCTMSPGNLIHPTTRPAPP